MRFKAGSAGLLAAIISGPITAGALPTLYPDFFNRNVKNQTNSNYLADNRDHTRFYVLPPNDAVVRPRALHTVTANVGFCREIAELQKYNLDTLQLLNSMKTREEQGRAQLVRDQQRLQEEKRALADHAAGSGLQELAALDVRIYQLEQRLDHLYDRYRECVRDCEILNREIQQSQRLRTELQARRTELGAANFAAAVEYERRRHQVRGIEENLRQAEADHRRLRADLLDLYTQFNRMFDVHAQREGGRVSVVYDSGWSRNVEKLRRDNPAYRFERIQTKNAVIRAALLNRDRHSLTGAVMAFEVAGKNADGALNLDSYPESFSGDVVLNLLGVCPLLHPEWFSLPQPPKLQDMTFGLTVGYEYPAAMKYEVTAHYNMYRMYELIKSQGKSGGFFSTHSWSAHDEQLFFRDSFRVDWSIQDDKKIISPEQKQAVNADLRRQVMSRLATHLIQSDPAAPLALPGDPPRAGALVLADSLNGICPAAELCQGASLVLSALQSVFGSTELSQHLRQTLNVTMRDTYANESIVLQPMLTTYR